jgi:hypothetical protein
LSRNGRVLKTGIGGNLDRGFESHPRRPLERKAVWLSRWRLTRGSSRSRALKSTGVRPDPLRDGLMVSRWSLRSPALRWVGVAAYGAGAVFAQRAMQMMRTNRGGHGHEPGDGSHPPVGLTQDGEGQSQSPHGPIVQRTAARGKGWRLRLHAGVASRSPSPGILLAREGSWRQLPIPRLGSFRPRLSGA